MNPFLDRPPSYVAESQRLSAFLRALTIPLVVVVLHLLAGCETATTYQADGGKTVIKRVLPLDGVHIHLGKPQK